MKITLINPPKFVNYEQYDEAKFPHIGLGYLAGFLRKNNYQPDIIDCRLENIDNKECIRRIRLISPELVGLTSMTMEVNHTIKFAEQIKTEFPDIKIILGGVHATALPLETMTAYPLIDYLVIGEGEKTLLELLDSIKDKCELSRIKGLAYRTGNDIFVNKQRPFENDIDIFGEPYWEGFPEAEEYPIMTSRGCPYLCAFCFSQMGKKIRFRNMDLVIKEFIRVVEKFHPKLLWFYDETFGINNERTNILLDNIIKLGINKKVKWFAQTRVNHITKDLVLKMREAGCAEIGIGIESGNQKILDRIKKDITLDEVRRAVKILKEVKGILIRGYFQLGHPGETINTIKDTVNLAAELNLDEISVNITTPYPGTEIASMVKNKKWGYKILSSNWEDYHCHIGNAIELESISRRTLEYYQIFAYLNLFFKNFRIVDFTKFCFRYRREARAYLRDKLRKYLIKK